MAQENKDFVFQNEEEKHPLSPDKESGRQSPNEAEGKFSQPILRESPKAFHDASGDEQHKRLLEKSDQDVHQAGYFFASVSGLIESGKFPLLDGLSCKYHIVAGKDWELVDVRITTQSFL